MQPENKDETLEALREIRSIMDRSARFMSLSGWSGVWAGCTALVGAWIAYGWMQRPDYQSISVGKHTFNSGEIFDPLTLNFMYLAIGVFLTALAGGSWFTWKKAKKHHQKLWNSASQQMLLHLFFPLFAGGVFAMIFVYYGAGMFVAPACLVFYGLALISASRHTLSDIRYLGMLNVALGCTNLFFPGFGLYFWALGFGVLHILYGIMMRNKYDR